MKINLSIIVPIFNGSKHCFNLIKTLNSLTLHNFEIIIVNDGSSDNTIDILQQLIGHDHKYKLVTQPNLGVAGARNTGIKEARGKWIFFLDADDEISPSYFDFLNDEIFTSDEPPELVIVNGVFDVYGGKKIKWNVPNLCQAENILSYALKTKVMKYVWGKLYLREFINKNEVRFQNLVIAEDFLFNVSLSIVNPKVINIDSGYYYYNQNISSATKIYTAKNMLSRLHAIKRISDIIPDSHENNLLWKRLFMEFFLYQTLKHLSKTTVNDKREIISVIREQKENICLTQIPYLPISMKAKMYFFMLICKYQLWG
ncbi:glycosyltransferase family 2 protein [Scandinavium sp. NPDC088450]|uniref:glycosyltransferase family 2 protein n=1 Tax=Scandinavium sp. NPDC088450 TaxID=3364514 RepID=UPI00384AD6E8